MTNRLKHTPRPGEVWTVDDDEIMLHVDNRVHKGSRPVVIIMPQESNLAAMAVANVAPLSTSCAPDPTTIPVARGYEDLAQDFKPDPSSCAVLAFYQPIDLRFFTKYRGRLNEETVVMLKGAIQTGVVGLPEYCFDP
jgi:mRNA-degrading endonuclease toxin of MazEF toxin-antitoxin module